MFKNSSKYGLPDNSDQMIWRYMKLGRFEEMLEKRSGSNMTVTLLVLLFKLASIIHIKLTNHFL